MQQQLQQQQYVGVEHLRNAELAQKEQHQKQQKQQELESEEKLEGKGPAPTVEAAHVVCVSIAACSMLGCLTRVFIQELFTSEGVDVFPQTSGGLTGSVYANTLGCLLLGVLTAWRAATPELWPYLYVGISTGFCGSLTTFSTWALGLAQVFVEDEEWGGQQQVAAFTVSLALLAFFIASFLVGSDIGRKLERPRELLDRAPETGPHGSRIGQPDSGGRGCGSGVRRRHRRNAHSVLCLLPTLMALLFLGLGLSWKNHRREAQWCLSALLAPVGALLRYTLAKRFNGEGRNRWGAGFPLGTYAANLLGCVALALAMYGYSKDWYDAHRGWRRTLLVSFSTGVLSSLTTMSTFTGEVVGLRKLKTGGVMKSYRYAVVTVVSTISVACLLVAVLG